MTHLNEPDFLNKPDFGTKKTGMFVPDGFFADFQKEMEAKIDEFEAQKSSNLNLEQTAEPHREGRIVPLWQKVAMSAACACLLVAMYPLYKYVSASDDVPVQVATTLAETSASYESQEQLNQEVMLSSMSDCDMYEYYCYGE